MKIFYKCQTLLSVGTYAYEAVAWHFLETRTSQVVQGWPATEGIGTVPGMGTALHVEERHSHLTLGLVGTTVSPELLRELKGLG